MKRFWSWLVSLWPKAKPALDLAADLAAKALPVIKIAGEIVTTLTPSGIDDAAWAQIKAKFPRLFDGTIHTGDELKLYALAVATELLRARFPGVDTSTARLAVQAAYVAEKA